MKQKKYSKLGRNHWTLFSQIEEKESVFIGTRQKREAREYMVAYFILSIQQNNNPAEENDAVNGVNLDQLAPCTVSAEKIEQMKQRVKTHQAAI